MEQIELLTPAELLRRLYETADEKTKEEMREKYPAMDFRPAKAMSPVEELYTKVIALLPDEVLREHGQAILEEAIRQGQREKKRLMAVWKNARAMAGTSYELEDFLEIFEQL